MQVTYNSKILFCFEATRKDMCEVTVMRGYYWLKMDVQFDSGYSLCAFLKGNETVFFEETILWCIFLITRREKE